MASLRALSVLCLAMLTSGLPAQAAMPPQAGQPGSGDELNVVELQAEAQREVPNDLLNAVLYFEANDTDPARLAALLNRTGNDALKAAADFKGVRLRSGGSHTFPVYDRNQKLGTWRGRTEVRLDSRDFEAASKLISRLQTGMQLASISFSVSRQLQTETENALIGEAVQAFRARADIVRQALSGTAYRMRRMNISTGSSAPPPRPMLRMAAAAPGEIAAPQLEGGLSTVVVNVNGAIQIESR